MRKPLLLLPLLFLFALGFTSCKSEGCTDPAAANFDANADKDDGSCIYSSLPSLYLSIQHVIDDVALEKDKKIYTNSAGNLYSVSRLRYYLSDFTLYTAGGDSVFIPYFHYIDAFEPATITAAVLSSIPEGTYNAIRFNFGLTPRLNHLDSLPNSEPHASFTWPHMMGGGYHYMQLEGSYDNSSSESRFYNTHMGHLKNATADVDPNFSVKYSIPEIQSAPSTSFKGYQLIIKAELNEWYQNPNTYNFEDYDGGIMGNPQAQQILKENGQSVFSVKDVAVLVE